MDENYQGVGFLDEHIKQQEQEIGRLKYLLDQWKWLFDSLADNNDVVVKKLNSYRNRAGLFSMTEFFKEINKPDFRNEIYEKEISRLESDLREAVEIIKLIQWATTNGRSGELMCWACQSKKYLGHLSSCQVGNFLAKCGGV